MNVNIYVPHALLNACSYFTKHGTHVNLNLEKTLRVSNYLDVELVIKWHLRVMFIFLYSFKSCAYTKILNQRVW